MRDTVAIINELRQQGVRFVPEGGSLKVVSPKGIDLSEEIKSEIRRRKGEILARLRSGSATPEDVTAVVPGAEDVTAAVLWLRAKLTHPQHIALVIAEWLCALGRPTSRDLDTLMQVRWALGGQAYVGRDDRFWWRLPQETVQ